MTDTALESQFELVSERLSASPEQRRLRRAAFDAFRARGFPTRRDEAWHYTDLKLLGDAGFDYSAVETNEAAHAAAEALLATLPASSAAVRAVFVDGRLDKRLSRLDTASGIGIASLADSGLERVAGHRDALPSHRDALAGHPLAALNTAFGSDGLSVTVSAGITSPEPVHLVLIGTGASGIAVHPRIAIELEANASLDVVMHLVDGTPSASWLNLVTRVSQAEGSRLSLHRLQEHTAEQIHTSLLRADLAKDAALEVGYIDLGARLARNDFDVHLAEPGASADVFGMFHASEGQHIDDHVQMVHAAPRTTSSEAFRGIADGNGRGIFNGKIVVLQDAQKIDAHQSSDNLLLSDKAEIDTKPELEIYADDVKCSHGATIGELDPEHLFYLRSRGIDEAAARGLLTYAFANRILRRFRPDALRERAAVKVVGYLPERQDMEGLV